MAGAWLITGANRGIGLEFVRQLQQSGESVIACARDPSRAAALTSQPVRVEALDVTSDAQTAALAARLGDVPVDILINNAGIGQAGDGDEARQGPTLEALQPAEVMRFLEVNSVSPVRVTRAVLRNLRAGKRRIIINMSSSLGSIANNREGGWYGYRASKCALNMLTVTMAHELRPQGFTCVAMHPGWVRTDMGGQQAPLSVEESVAGMLRVIAGLGVNDSGRFLDYEGRDIPW